MKQFYFTILFLYLYSNIFKLQNLSKLVFYYQKSKIIVQFYYLYIILLFFCYSHININYRL